MSSRINQKSIKTMKNDFSKYQEIIEIIVENKELFSELASDYYLCKRNFQFAENNKKKFIAEEYRKTLEELKKEIVEFFKNNKLEDKYHN